MKAGFLVNDDNFHEDSTACLHKCVLGNVFMAIALFWNSLSYLISRLTRSFEAMFKLSEMLRMLNSMTVWIISLHEQGQSDM